MNFDLSFLSGLPAACSMSIPFLEQFGLSTIFPIFITVAIKVGQFLATFRVKDKARRTAQKATGSKIFLFFIMLLFPSIANKSFSVFRCRSILGLDFDVLDDDFSVRCWEEHHVTYVAIAFVSIGVCKLWGVSCVSCVSCLWVGCSMVSSILFSCPQMRSVFHCTYSSICGGITTIFICKKTEPTTPSMKRRTDV